MNLNFESAFRFQKWVWTRGVRHWFVSYQPTKKWSWYQSALAISAHGGCASDSCRTNQPRNYSPRNSDDIIFAHGGCCFDCVEYVRRCCSGVLLMLEHQYTAFLNVWYFGSNQKTGWKAPGQMLKRWYFRAKQQNGRISLVFVSAKPTTFSEKAVWGLQPLYMLLINRCAFWCLLKKHQNGHWNCIINWFLKTKKYYLSKIEL